MADTPQSQLVEEIARDLVGQIAPHELPLFRATSAAYFRRSARSLKTQGARDEMLGFGTDTAVTFLTPIVPAVTNEVVEFVAASVKTSAAADSGNLAVAQAKRTFRKYQPLGLGGSAGVAADIRADRAGPPAGLSESLPAQPRRSSGGDSGRCPGRQYG